MTNWRHSSCRRLAAARYQIQTPAKAIAQMTEPKPSAQKSFTSMGVVLSKNSGRSTAAYASPSSDTSATIPTRISAERTHFSSCSAFCMRSRRSRLLRLPANPISCFRKCLCFWRSVIPREISAVFTAFVMPRWCGMENCRANDPGYCPKTGQAPRGTCRGLTPLQFGSEIVLGKVKRVRRVTYVKRVQGSHYTSKIHSHHSIRRRRSCRRRMCYTADGAAKAHFTE